MYYSCATKKNCLTKTFRCWVLERKWVWNYLPFSACQIKDWSKFRGQGPFFIPILEARATLVTLIQGGDPAVLLRENCVHLIGHITTFYLGLTSALYLETQSFIRAGTDRKCTRGKVTKIIIDVTLKTGFYLGRTTSRSALYY